MTMLSTIFINQKSTRRNDKRGWLEIIIKDEDTKKKVFFQLFVSFPFLDKKFLRALESSFRLALRAYVRLSLTRFEPVFSP